MPFAPINEVSAGTQLRADGGFPCLGDGEVKTVEQDGDGLYIPCAKGHHYLDGQRSDFFGDDSEPVHYVGLTLVVA